jgi:DedD protein
VQAIKKPVITAHVTPAKKPAVASVKKVAPKNPPKTVAATTETVNLKKPAWMVQLGSFKNKINAERLTNNLRAKGYKAFTLQGKGSSVTRVCVGPEFQQTKAATLAGKIAQDTNLRGIVMSYKPLEL